MFHRPAISGGTSSVCRALASVSWHDLCGAPRLASMSDLVNSAGSRIWPAQVLNATSPWAATSNSGLSCLCRGRPAMRRLPLRQHLLRSLLGIPGECCWRKIAVPVPVSQDQSQYLQCGCKSWLFCLCLLLPTVARRRFGCSSKSLLLRPRPLHSPPLKLQPGHFRYGTCGTHLPKW